MRWFIIIVAALCALSGCASDPATRAVVSEIQRGDVPIYVQYQAALNTLMANGSITQADYDARVSYIQFMQNLEHKYATGATTQPTADLIPSTQP